MLAATLAIGLTPTAAAAPRRQAPVTVVSTTYPWRVEVYDYAGTGDPNQQLTATYAPGRTNAPWVVTIHGGSWINGSQANVTNAVQLFSRRGWQAFNLSYRVGPDVTVDQQEQDVATARDWIKAHAAQFGINPNRGTVYGFSAGGHLAAAAGMAGGFRVAVTLSGVLQPHRVADDALGKRPDTEPATNANISLYGREEQMMGCQYAGVNGSDPCAQRWRAFAPEFAVNPNASAFYIVQGGDDPVVPPSTATAFAYHLDQAHIPNSVLVIPGYGHTPQTIFDSGAREEAMLRWIAERSA